MIEGSKIDLIGGETPEAMARRVLDDQDLSLLSANERALLERVAKRVIELLADYSMAVSSGDAPSMVEIRKRLFFAIETTLDILSIRQIRQPISAVARLFEELSDGLSGVAAVGLQAAASALREAIYGAIADKLLAGR